MAGSSQKSTRSASSKPKQTQKTQKKNTSPSRTGGAKKSAPSRSKVELGELHALDRELAGVALIFVGVILGIFCYFGSSGLLAAVAPFLFGLFGMSVYVLPIFLIVLGILLITVPKNDLKPVSIACIAVIFFAMIALVHAIMQGKTLVGERFSTAVTDAYRMGADHVGGGVFGGIIAFLFVLLLGRSGAIVALIGVLLIAALLLTHFSIGAYLKHLQALHSERAEVRSRERSAAPRRARQRAYNEELSETLYGDEDGDEFIEHSGRPLTSGDTGYDYDNPARSGSAIRSRRSERTPDFKEPVKKQEREKTLPRKKAAKHGDDLEFFPVSGPIKTGKPPKKRNRLAELDESFTSPAPAADSFESSASSSFENEVYADFEEGLGGGQAAASDDDFLSGAVIEIYDPNPSKLSADDIALTEEDGANAVEAVEANADAPSEIAALDPELEGMKVEPPAPVYVYQRPPLNLLKLPDPTVAVASEPPEEKARILIETLNSFNISARVVNISVGPVITRYELQPAQGVRVNRITSLSNDIALALAAPRVRIEAPIPGKSAIGIEIPNRSTIPVLLRELLETADFNAAKAPLTFALGKDIAGKVVLGDLGKMPHMLVAGQTGAGKSVCINGIILSLIYKSSPKDVRMILIDPKVVELSIFATLPHLFCPVVTEPKKAAGALRWAVNEMDQRYKRMAEVHARDIDRYNAVQTDENERWPRLVIIIDELADLMIVASKDVEDSICRIAQLGRACGIHLIVATQRPSVDVITGLIKANIPSRIAFAVSNGTDSRVILDASGAEKLLGRGDMLFHPNGASKPTRAQGAFVSDEEVEAVAEFFTKTASQQPTFHEEILSEISSSGSSTPGQGNGKQEDELLPDAARLVIESGAASISMIQRRLRVGYARAARLIDIMEQKGYVSPADGAKPRRVLISAAEYNDIFGGDMPARPQSQGDYE